VCHEKHLQKRDVGEYENRNGVKNPSRISIYVSEAFEKRVPRMKTHHIGKQRQENRDENRAQQHPEQQTGFRVAAPKQGMYKLFHDLQFVDF